jgi:hypothetical protein
MHGAGSANRLAVPPASGSEPVMAKPLPLQVKDEYLPRELGELRKDIESLPRQCRERMLPLCDRICHFLHLQGRLFEMAQETVDRLQLDVKYLLFDLDCTQRERDEAVEELENLTEGW